MEEEKEDVVVALPLGNAPQKALKKSAHIGSPSIFCLPKNSYTFALL